MEQNASEPAGAASRWSWLGGVVLALLPVVLAVAGYYTPAIAGSGLPPGGMDLPFYQYQFTRAGEVSGRWWRLADDPTMGGHYQSEVAKHPGIFEGVDLLLAAVLPARWLGPNRLYHLVGLLVFAANGWAAGWMVRRLTGSYAWAALAVVLLTLNVATANRVFTGHPHLAKHGWVLLACWAFAAYLARPTVLRGVLLGLAAAGVLQGSFYMGYLLGLAMFTWWAGCLVAKRVGREHLIPTIAAGLAFAAAAAVLTFPVWTVARSNLLNEGYLARRWGETWYFGAELWQYFLPTGSPAADGYFDGVKRFRGSYGEGWYFPGYSVVAAVGVYVFARLRGWKFPSRYAAVLDVLMGLMGISVVLSLSGGPGFFLFHVFPSFRVYGRAGSVVVAAGCVAAPLVFAAVAGGTRLRVARHAAVVAALALAVTDARRSVAVVSEEAYRVDETLARRQPEWVGWLARQPKGVRLAAFSPGKKDPFYWWGVNSLKDRLVHGHTTLNGCDFSLLDADLRLLGATYDWMTPEAFRFLASLGFDTYAFDKEYLDGHPWLRTHPAFDWVETLGPWKIARANAALTRLPKEHLETILAGQPKNPPAVEVPPRCWVTGQLAVDRDVVVPGQSRAYVAWADADGRLVEAPTRALFQHILGPNYPSFTVRTPKAPGRYDLVFLDASRRKVAAKPYRVVEGLTTSVRAFGKAAPAVTLGEAVWSVEPGASPRFVVENTSPYYLQAHADREEVPPSVRAHPGFGLGAYDPGSVYLLLRGFAAGPGDGPLLQAQSLPLPRDLAPGERLVVDIPPGRVIESARLARMTLSPVFDQFPKRIAAADGAGVRLSVSRVPDPPATRQAEATGSRALTR
jgi:hypothetical protein